MGTRAPKHQADRAARTQEHRVPVGQRGSQRAPASVAQAELDCGQDQAPPTMIIPSTITRQGMPRAGLPRAADRPLTPPLNCPPRPPAASTSPGAVIPHRRSSASGVKRHQGATCVASSSEPVVERVHEAWRQTNRKGITVGRCNVARLRTVMGVVCRKRIRTTVFGPTPTRSHHARLTMSATVHRTFANALGAAASPASPPEAGSLCDHHDRVRAPHRRKARKPDSARGLGLKLDAFGQTLHARQLAHGLVHHADRGSVLQYPLRRRPCRSWRPPVRRRGRRQQRTRSKA